MKLVVKSKFKDYPIFIKKDLLSNISEYFDTEIKTLIISDSGIPSIYIELLKNQLKNELTYIIPKGEKSKDLKIYEKIIEFLNENNFTRNDRIIALGGGVVGDLSAFVASTYKRGIKFINIPTTTLSMIDSSIGGKTAINIDNTKNIIGTFYAPDMVLIDVNVLKTLDVRNYNNGLVEAIKMAMTHNKEFFEKIFSNSLDIEEIIYNSLLIKKEVVEKDEFEKNIRKSLNFGHTFGHAIESLEKFDLLHGECVALGILMISKDKEYYGKILSLFNKLNIQVDKINSVNYKDLFMYVVKDKKTVSDKYIDIIEVNEIGSFTIEKIEIDQLFQKCGG